MQLPARAPKRAMLENAVDVRLARMCDAQSVYLKCKFSTIISITISAYVFL